MERKDFLVGATAGLLTNAQVSNADGHDKKDKSDGERGEGRQRRGERQGGGNRMSGIANMITGTVGASWVGLSFMVDVDDETLIKARPIYKETMDKSKQMVSEAMKSQDWQSIRPKMGEIMENHKSSMKNLLSEDQMSKLEEYEKEQQSQQMQRFGGGGGGGGGGGRGRDRRGRGDRPQRRGDRRNGDRG